MDLLHFHCASWEDDDSNELSGSEYILLTLYSQPHTGLLPKPHVLCLYPSTNY